MKRRLYSVLICCVILFSLTIPAYATETKEYILDELGMTVSLPSDYIVFLREIDANDPNLSAYGLTKDSMTSLMEERNIYLNGWDADNSQEIIITMIDSPLDDFNSYSDTTLSTITTALEPEYEKLGITVIESEIYCHTQAKFLKMHVSQPNEGSTVYGLQYYTVYANKAINITMQSYSGQITASQEAVIKSIVDSAEFDTAPQTTETNSLPTDAFTYTDTETTTTFLVPANWVETPFTKEREYIDVKFTSLIEDGMSIIYGSHDLWNEMTPSDRGGLNRSDIDNSSFTKSDIAEIFDIASNEIETVTYGGNEYYTATVTSTADASGLSFTVTMTCMICVENGYMHWFQFSGEKTNNLYCDFETLLSSVNFPQPTSAGHSEPDSDLTSQFSFVNILISLIITIIFYSLPIIIYRYAIKKEPVEKKKAKKITIIYGICAFIVMSIFILVITGNDIAGGAIVLWSWINYRVLIGGKKKPVAPANADSETSVASISEPDQADSLTQMDEPDNFTPPNELHEKICTNCGTAMPIESTFCQKCGAKMI